MDQYPHPPRFTVPGLEGAPLFQGSETNLFFDKISLIFFLLLENMKKSNPISAVVKLLILEVFRSQTETNYQVSLIALFICRKNEIPP